MREYVCVYLNEVAQCMAFGGVDWAGDRETRQVKTAVQEKRGTFERRVAHAPRQ